MSKVTVDITVVTRDKNGATITFEPGQAVDEDLVKDLIARGVCQRTDVPAVPAPPPAVEAPPNEPTVDAAQGEAETSADDQSLTVKVEIARAAAEVAYKALDTAKKAAASAKGDAKAAAQQQVSEQQADFDANRKVYDDLLAELKASEPSE